jgi:hypothetical protein
MPNNGALAVQGFDRIESKEERPWRHSTSRPYEPIRCKVSLHPLRERDGQALARGYPNGFMMAVMAPCCHRLLAGGHASGVGEHGTSHCSTDEQYLFTARRISHDVLAVPIRVSAMLLVKPSAQHPERSSFI